MKYLKLASAVLLTILLSGKICPAQDTKIMGFVDVLSFYKDDKLNFAFGEQDLFITSELNDKISFLGETVFKFDAGSGTNFSLSVERIVIKYNLKGNHYLLLGKHHTPINYWNDSYHHGRVLFPNIYRPLLFQDFMIPLHTTGISIQGLNLTKLNFGYDVMIGNGIGSGDLADNDDNKSITAAVHIKPFDGFRAGASFYYDKVSAGVEGHHGSHSTGDDLPAFTQMIYSGSLSYFKNNLELLGEGSMVTNDFDSTGSYSSFGSYVHAGYRVTPKIIPYVRYDLVDYDGKDMWFGGNSRQSFIVGARYEFSYLAVLKGEFQQTMPEIGDDSNMITLQFAIGF